MKDYDSRTSILDPLIGSVAKAIRLSTCSLVQWGESMFPSERPVPPISCGTSLLTQMEEIRVSQVPESPLPHLCPVLRPRPTQNPSPISGCCCCPQSDQVEGSSLCSSFRGSITRLQCTLSTLHLVHYCTQCKTRFRLVASLYRRGLLPPGTQ